MVALENWNVVDSDFLSGARAHWTIVSRKQQAHERTVQFVLGNYQDLGGRARTIVIAIVTRKNRLAHKLSKGEKQRSRYRRLPSGTQVVNGDRERR